MKYQIAVLSVIMIMQTTNVVGDTSQAHQEQLNKRIAQSFYQDLWFSNNTENYAKYVDSSYVVHDIGDRKGIREASIEQKKIADFFWDNGKLNCELDFQIAEGNLVATRWIAGYEPETLTAKLLIGSNPIPIINVFRIEKGKIVEIWNHRHDIDTNQTDMFLIKGILIGILIAMIPTFLAFRLKRKLNGVRNMTGA